MSSDMFMQIDGGKVKGESKDNNHTDWIEIANASWNVTQQGSMEVGQGGTQGRADFSHFVVDKVVDLSSTAIAEKCASGEHFDEVIWEACKAGQTQNVYMRVTMNKAIISSYQLHGTAGDGAVMTESFSLNYEEIKVEYIPQTDTGGQGAATEFAWNTAKHASA